MFPFAYVYMTGRTKLLYDAVLDRVKTVIRDFTGRVDNVPVELSISDYETAILSAMEDAFPGCRSRGCWFHFGQVSHFYLLAFTSNNTSLPVYIQESC